MEVAAASANLFSEEFLIKRPLLQAIDASHGQAPVLLIDELDRSDEEFEGFLLELLGDFQITIPELGSFAAVHPPIVIITSNRTREIHDALKRRCLYYWIDYPDFQKEMQIITSRLPEAPRRLAEQVTAFIQELRETELYKIPGISETLDWTSALLALNQMELEPGGHRRHPRPDAQVPGTISSWSVVDRSGQCLNGPGTGGRAKDAAAAAHDRRFSRPSPPRSIHTVTYCPTCCDS